MLDLESDTEKVMGHALSMQPGNIKAAQAHGWRLLQESAERERCIPAWSLQVWIACFFSWPFPSVFACWVG
ncbi:MAG: hypothetical protein NTW32_19880 [Chloroflexi bacterium]|nr:hypothetical protein [Chloroflexota bacterium]